MTNLLEVILTTSHHRSQEASDILTSPLGSNTYLLLPLIPRPSQPMIEYNIWRDSITNMCFLSVSSLLSDRECSSSPNLPPLFPRTAGSHCSSVPPALAPTALQKKHAPRVLDRHIAVASDVGQCHCCDACGQVAQRGVLLGYIERFVWDLPKLGSEGGWEARLLVRTTSGIRGKRPGGNLQSCEDMRRATNRWREVWG